MVQKLLMPISSYCLAHLQVSANRYGIYLLKYASFNFLHQVTAFLTPNTPLSSGTDGWPPSLSLTTSSPQSQMCGASVSCFGRLSLWVCQSLFVISCLPVLSKDEKFTLVNATPAILLLFLLHLLLPIFWRGVICFECITFSEKSKN